MKTGVNTLFCSLLLIFCIFTSAYAANENSLQDEFTILQPGNERLTYNSVGDIYLWYADLSLARKNSEDWPYIKAFVPNEFIVVPPAVKNINDDRAREIFIVSKNGDWNYSKIHVLDFKGENVIQPVKINYTPSFSPLFADADNDGIDEMLLGDTTGHVYIYKINNINPQSNITSFNEISNWQSDIDGRWLIGDNSPMCPYALDLNMDGYIDIIATSQKGNICTFLYQPGSPGGNNWIKSDTIVLNSSIDFSPLVYTNKNNAFLLAAEKNGQLSLYQWSKIENKWNTSSEWSTNIGRSILSRPVFVKFQNDTLSLAFLTINREIIAYNFDQHQHIQSSYFIDQLPDCINNTRLYIEKINSGLEQLVCFNGSELLFYKFEGDRICRIKEGEFIHSGEPVISDMKFNSNPIAQSKGNIFSPNNDNICDNLEFSFSLTSDALVNIRVDILDKDQNIVNTLFNTRTTTCFDQNILWDGKGSIEYNQNAVVADGIYSIRVQLKSSESSEEKFEYFTNCIVDTTPPLISDINLNDVPYITTIKTKADIVCNIMDPSLNSKQDSINNIEICLTSQNSGRKFTVSRQATNGDNNFEIKGMDENANNVLLDDGIYDLSVQVSDCVGNKGTRQLTRSIEIDRTPATVSIISINNFIFQPENGEFPIIQYTLNDNAFSAILTVDDMRGMKVYESSLSAINKDSHFFPLSSSWTGILDWNSLPDTGYIFKIQTLDRNLIDTNGKNIGNTNSNQCVGIKNRLSTFITMPADNDKNDSSYPSITNSTVIKGCALDPDMTNLNDFSSYRLYYAKGMITVPQITEAEIQDPQGNNVSEMVWNAIPVPDENRNISESGNEFISRRPVANSILGFFNADALEDGIYSLLLVTKDDGGHYSYDIVNVNIVRKVKLHIPVIRIVNLSPTVVDSFGQKMELNYRISNLNSSDLYSAMLKILRITNVSGQPDRFIYKNNIDVKESLFEWNYKGFDNSYVQNGKYRFELCLINENDGSVQENELATNIEVNLFEKIMIEKFEISETGPVYPVNSEMNFHVNVSKNSLLSIGVDTNNDGKIDDFLITDQALAGSPGIIDSDFILKWTPSQSKIYNMLALIKNINNTNESVSSSIPVIAGDASDIGAGSASILSPQDNSLVNGVCNFNWYADANGTYDPKRKFSFQINVDSPPNVNVDSEAVSSGQLVPSYPWVEYDADIYKNAKFINGENKWNYMIVPSIWSMVFTEDQLNVINVNDALKNYEVAKYFGVEQEYRNAYKAVGMYPGVRFYPGSAKGNVEQYSPSANSTSLILSSTSSNVISVKDTWFYWQGGDFPGPEALTSGFKSRSVYVDLLIGGFYTDVYDFFILGDVLRLDTAFLGSHYYKIQNEKGKTVFSKSIVMPLANSTVIEKFNLPAGWYHFSMYSDYHDPVIKFQHYDEKYSVFGAYLDVFAFILSVDFPTGDVASGYKEMSLEQVPGVSKVDCFYKYPFMQNEPNKWPNDRHKEYVYNFRKLKDQNPYPGEQLAPLENKLPKIKIDTGINENDMRTAFSFFDSISSEVWDVFDNATAESINTIKANKETYIKNYMDLLNNIGDEIRDANNEVAPSAGTYCSVNHLNKDYYSKNFIDNFMSMFKVPDYFNDNNIYYTIDVLHTNYSIPNSSELVIDHVPVDNDHNGSVDNISQLRDFTVDVKYKTRPGRGDYNALTWPLQFEYPFYDQHTNLFYETAGSAHALPGYNPKKQYVLRNDVYNSNINDINFKPAAKNYNLPNYRTKTIDGFVRKRETFVSGNITNYWKYQDYKAKEKEISDITGSSYIPITSDYQRYLGNTKSLYPILNSTNDQIHFFIGKFDVQNQLTGSTSPYVAINKDNYVMAASVNSFVFNRQSGIYDEFISSNYKNLGAENIEFNNQQPILESDSVKFIAERDYYQNPETEPVYKGNGGNGNIYYYFYTGYKPLKTGFASKNKKALFLLNPSGDVPADISQDNNNDGVYLNYDVMINQTNGHSWDVTFLYPDLTTNNIFKAEIVKNDSMINKGRDEDIQRFKVTLNPDLFNDIHTPKVFATISGSINSTYQYGYNYILYYKKNTDISWISIKADAVNQDGVSWKCFWDVTGLNGNYKIRLIEKGQKIAVSEKTIYIGKYVAKNDITRIGNIVTSPLNRVTLDFNPDKNNSINALNNSDPGINNSQYITITPEQISEKINFNSDKNSPIIGPIYRLSPAGLKFDPAEKVKMTVKFLPEEIKNINLNDLVAYKAEEDGELKQLNPIPDGVDSIYFYLDSFSSVFVLQNIKTPEFLNNQTPVCKKIYSVKGMSEPAIRIDLKVNGVLVASGISDDQGMFDIPVGLAEGHNYISAKAVRIINNYGNSYTLQSEETPVNKILDIVLDTGRPQLHIGSFNPYLSPNGDNKNDQLDIEYQVNKDIQGIVFNIEKGEVPITTINANNKTGIISWDGKKNNGNPLTNGIYQLSIYAQDIAGNYSVTNQYQLFIDTVPPTADFEYIGNIFQSPENSNYFSLNSTIRITPHDDISGVDSVFQFKNGFRNRIADVVRFDSAGRKEIITYVMDKAKNEHIYTNTVFVDNNPPLVDLKLKEEYLDEENNPYIGSYSSIDIVGNDYGSNASGLNRVVYSINGDEWKSPFNGTQISSITDLEDGKYTLTYKAIDNVGNQSVEKKQIFVKDTSCPEIEYIITGFSFSNNGVIWLSEKSSLSLAYRDSGNIQFQSGIREVEYSFSSNNQWTVFSSNQKLEPPRGASIFKYKIRDHTGNVASNSLYIHPFYGLPQISLSFSSNVIARSNKTYLINNSSEIYLAGQTNNMIPLSDIQYSFDDKGISDYCNKIIFSGISSGEHILSYWGSDIFGDCSLTNIVKLYCINDRPSTYLCEIEDNTNIQLYADPQTGFYYAGSNFNIGFYRQSSLTDVGIKETLYSVDTNQTELLYERPFKLKEGLHFIKYASCDQLGNIENSQMNFVVIDSRAPKLFFMTDSDIYTNGYKWISPATKLIFVGSDGYNDPDQNQTYDSGGSGVKTIKYSINGNDWMSAQNNAFIRLLNFEFRTQVIDAYAEDYIGNKNDILKIHLLIDTKKPETKLIVSGLSCGFDPIYVNSESQLHLKAFDSDSGIYSINFKVGTNLWFTETGNTNIVLPNFADGTNEISFFAVDNSGLAESVCTKRIVCLQNLSVSQKTNLFIQALDPVYTNNGYKYTVKNNQFSIIDNTPGQTVNEIYYRLDNENSFMLYNGSFTISEPGSHIIEYYAMTNNELTEKYLYDIFIDDASPQVQIIANSRILTTESYVKAADLVHFEVSDKDSGIKSVKYCLKNDSSNPMETDWISYEDQKIAILNSTYLHVVADDHVLNTNHKSILIHVDDIKPHIDLTITGSGYQNNGISYIKNSDTMYLNASDNVPGIVQCYYNIDNQGYVLYTNGIQLNGNSHGLSFQYKAVDQAGNETNKVKIIAVDNLAPVLTISFGEPKLINLKDVPVSITPETPISIEAFENNSGINTVKYKIDNNDWQIYSLPFTIPANRNQISTIFYKAADNAGNETSVYSNNVMLICRAVSIIDSSVYPSVIYPDSFYENHCSISFDLSDSGIIDCMVMDNAGGIVKTFTQNSYADPKMIYGWDGQADNNQALSEGFYNIRIRVYNLFHEFSEEKNIRVKINRNSEPRIADAGITPSFINSSHSMDVDNNVAEIYFRLINNVIFSNVVVKLLNQYGDEMRTIYQAQAIPEGKKWIHWDGKDENSVPLSDGKYYFTISGQNIDEKMLGFTVDNLKPQILNNSVKNKYIRTKYSYSPYAVNNAEICFDLQDNNKTGNSVSIDISANSESVKDMIFSNLTNSHFEFPWNGKDNEDIALDSGFYSVIANAQDITGNCSDFVTNSIIIDNIDPVIDYTAWDSTNFSPNYPLGDGLKDTSVLYFIAHDNSMENLQGSVKIFNSNFIEVRSIVLNNIKCSNTNWIEWDGRDNSANQLADGKYYAQIEVYDTAGNYSCRSNLNIYIDTIPPVTENNIDISNTIISPANQDGQFDSSRISWLLNKHADINVAIEGESGKFICKAELSGKRYIKQDVVLNINSEATNYPLQDSHFNIRERYWSFSDYCRIEPKIFAKYKIFGSGIEQYIQYSSEHRDFPSWSHYGNAGYKDTDSRSISLNDQSYDIYQIANISQSKTSTSWGNVNTSYGFSGKTATVYFDFYAECCWHTVSYSGSADLLTSKYVNENRGASKSNFLLINYQDGIKLIDSFKILPVHSGGSIISSSYSVSNNSSAVVTYMNSTNMYAYKIVNNDIYSNIIVLPYKQKVFIECLTNNILFASIPLTNLENKIKLFIKKNYLPGYKYNPKISVFENNLVVYTQSVLQNIEMMSGNSFVEKTFSARIKYENNNIASAEVSCRKTQPAVIPLQTYFPEFNANAFEYSVVNNVNTNIKFSINTSKILNATSTFMELWQKSTNIQTNYTINTVIGNKFISPFPIPIPATINPITLANKFSVYYPGLSEINTNIVAKYTNFNNTAMLKIVIKSNEQTSPIWSSHDDLTLDNGKIIFTNQVNYNPALLPTVYNVFSKGHYTLPYSDLHIETILVKLYDLSGSELNSQFWYGNVKTDGDFDLIAKQMSAVKVLDEGYKEPGYYFSTWNGDDQYFANVSDGLYSVKVLVIDSSGNLSTLKKSITVDNKKPELSLSTPFSNILEQSLIAYSNQIPLEGIIFDRNLKQYNMSYQKENGIDWMSVERGNQNRNGLISVWDIDSLEGIYCLRIFAEDKAANTNSIVSRVKIKKDPHSVLSLISKNGIIDRNSISNKSFMIQYNLARPADVKIVLVSSDGIHKMAVFSNYAGIGDHVFELQDSIFSNDGKYQYIVSAQLTDPIQVYNERFHYLDVNLAKPLISFVSPLSNHFYHNILSISGSIQDENLEHFSLSYNKGNEENNKTILGEYTRNYLNETVCDWNTIGAEGVYHIAITAYDTFGQTETKDVPVLIDNNSPLISILSPSNFEYLKGNYIINGSIKDFSGKKIALSYIKIGENNFTMITQFQRTGDISGNISQWNTSGLNGSYQLKIVVEDEAGNVSEKIRNVNLDNIPPLADNILPEEGSLCRSNISFTGHVFDMNLRNLSLSYKKKDQQIWKKAFDKTFSQNEINGVFTVLNSQSIPDAEYDLKFDFSDLADNHTIIYKNINIDNNPPEIVIVSPENNAYISGNAKIVGSIYDLNLNNYKIKYKTDNASSDWTLLEDVQALHSITNAPLVEWITSAYNDGKYRIMIEAADSAEFINKSVFYVNLDNTKPKVMIDNPINNEIYCSNLSVSISITDKNIDKYRLEYKLQHDENYQILKNETVNSNLTQVNIVSLKFLPNLKSSAILKLIVYDKAGNSNSTITSFYIDNSSPELSVDSPVSNTIYGQIISISGKAVGFGLTNIGIYYQLTNQKYTWHPVTNIKFSLFNRILTNQFLYNWTLPELNSKIRIKIVAKNFFNRTIDNILPVLLDRTKPEIYNVQLIPKNLIANSKLRLSFNISEKIQMEVKVFDKNSNLVDILFSSLFTNNSFSTQWNETDSFVNSIPEGKYFFQIRCSDLVGNTNDPVIVPFNKILDNTPPVTMLVPNINLFTNKQFQFLYSPAYCLFSFNAVDDLSDIKATRYFISDSEIDPFVLPDSEWITYTNSFSLNTEGFHYIYYYSIDNFNNSENFKTNKIFIDKKPPQIWIKNTNDICNNVFIKAGAKIYLAVEETNSYHVPTGAGLFLYMNGKYIDGFSTNQPLPFNQITNEIYCYAVDPSQNISVPLKKKLIIDNNAPQTAVSVSNSVYISNKCIVNLWSRIFLIANDGTGSGVAQIEYSILNTNQTASAQDFNDIYSLPLSVTGNCRLYYRSIDILGNAETDQSGNFKFRDIIVDNDPPVTALHCKGISYNKNGNLFVTKNASVILSATDTLSGVESIYFSLSQNLINTNELQWSHFTNDNLLNNMTGNTEFVYYFSQDLLHNKETVKIQKMIIDDFCSGVQFLTNTPEPFSPYGAPNKLIYNINEDSIISIGIIDKNGNAVNQICSDLALSEGIHTNTWNGLDFFGDMVVEGNYQYKIEIRDLLGNQAPIISSKVTVCLDKMPPRTKISIGSPQYSNYPIYIRKDTPITLTAFDDLIETNDNKGLGVHNIYYKISDQAWNVYTNTFFISSEGMNEISYFSKDRTGNEEEIKRLSLGVDNTAPSSGINISGPQYSDNNIHYINSKTYIQFISSDPIVNGVSSGCDRIEFRSINSNWSIYSNPFNILGTDGFYQINYRSVDHIGNRENDKIYSITLDNSPPNIPQNVLSLIQKTNIFIYWSAVTNKDLAGYNVYRNGIKINVTPLISIVCIDTLKISGLYEYKITSIDKVGNESTYSLPVLIKTGDQVKIIDPKDMDYFCHVVRIKAIIKAYNGKGLWIDIGSGQTPSTWQNIYHDNRSFKRNHEKAVFCAWNTENKNGDYLIRVRTKENNIWLENSVPVYVDNTTPITKILVNSNILNCKETNVLIGTSLTFNATDPIVNNVASGIKVIKYHLERLDNDHGRWHENRNRDWDDICRDNDFNSYCWDNGKEKVWDGNPIYLTIPGLYIIKYYSIDNAMGYHGEWSDDHKWGRYEGHFIWDENENIGNKEHVNFKLIRVLHTPPGADVIPPVITIVGVNNGLYTSAIVKPIFTITDAHLKSTSILIDNKIGVSGQLISSEGPHSLVVSATDAAGNSTSVTMKFVIDRIAPIISISGYSNGGYYGSDVTPLVTITELNPSVNSILLDGTSFVSGTPIQSEATHNLSVYANDKAGNSSTKSSTFTIDKIAPQITISGVAQGNYYRSKVTIQVSVSDNNLRSSTLSIDGAPFQGSKDVSSEGHHILAIRAEDKAGNVSVSSVDFTIDMTSPVIQITGVEQNKTYIEATPIVTLQDLNLDNSKSWITLDSKPFTSGTLVSSNGNHFLMAHAQDLAGNLNDKSVNFQIYKQTMTNSLLFYASYNTSANADQSMGNGNVQSGGEITSSGLGWKIGEALSDTGRGASYSSVNNFSETNGTVMMWVKSSWINAGEQGRYLFSLNEDNHNGGSGNSIYAANMNNNSIENLSEYMNLVVFGSKGTVLQIKDKNGRYFESVIDKGAETGRWYSDKNWTHIAYTWNAKTGAIKMYLNGSLKGSFTNQAWIPNKKTDLWIGNRHNDESRQSSCRLDEVMIFNRELNINEINEKAGFNKISSVYTADTNLKFAYLEKGEKYYCDRDYVITNMDSVFKDSLFIKTANNDKQFSANTKYLGFKAEENLDIIIGFDSRVAIPAWLSSGFTAWMENGKQKTIGTTDVGNQKALLFKKSISKGTTIQLNGNGASNDNTYNYFVILKRQ